MTAVRSSVLARLVFALLALATVGAFFITQRLKSSDPVVKRLALPLYVSPNGDGRKDTAPIAFDLPKGDRVTVAIVNGAGDEVRRLADDRRLGRGHHEVTWDGRDSHGKVVHDGVYFARVTLRAQGRAVTGPRGVTVETSRPRPRLTSARRVAHGAVELSFTGPASPPPVFDVYRTDVLGHARKVDTFVGERGQNTARWPGFIGLDPAPPGDYAFSVTVQNKALVAGSAPPRLPPTGDTAAPGTGVSIVTLDLAPPLEPVTAGRLARVAVGGPPRRFKWKLVRLGSVRPLRAGNGSGHRLGFRVPAGAPAGVYTLSVAAAGHRAAVPIAVRAPGRARVLVVLPAITWQGRNAADGDASGFTETLDDSSAVGAARPFAGGRLPDGFAADVAPLMRFLGRRGYDLTTDLALARGHGPPLAGHSGVLFPGSERWLTDSLDLGLRGYVNGGGKVAFFGGDSFRRRVRVSGDLLSGPSAPERVNVFSERTSIATGDPAPIVRSKDALKLFAGTDGLVGNFTRLERSDALVAGAKLQTAAGRDPGHPALVGYRLGKGTVVRVGVPGWAAALASGGEEATVTKRIWALLSR
ncbi:MAG: hypothetical protein QOJ07_2510 [Thermoleophilaceae bacterium]|nr:hypothetical protein [Thermoleophilaceae bacterium]